MIGEDVGQLSKDLDMGDEGRDACKLEKAVINGTAQNSKDAEEGIGQMVIEDVTEPSMDDSMSSSL